MGAPVVQPSVAEAIVEAVKAGGRSLGAIARELGVAKSTVSRYARLAGVAPSQRAFAPEKRAAHESRREELARRRAALSSALLAEAERRAAMLTQPHTAFNFGGKDNTYAERELPEPDVRAAREMVTTIAILVDKHRVLEAIDAGAEATETGSLLDALADSLQSGGFGSGSAHRVE